jgi:hypothetical protein
MVSAARRFGEGPTARDIAEKAMAQAAELRVLLAEILARIVALEDQLVAAGDEDGPAPQPLPLPPNWKPLKQAVALSGFSSSGLRKLRAPHWWKYVAGRVWIDTAACPRKAV